MYAMISHLNLNLVQGITKNKEYEAWKFPGGEIHFKLTNESIKYLNIQKPPYLIIKANLVSSDDIILLAIVCDTIAKDWPDTRIKVFIPYFAYQQADRDFSQGECFSLLTIAKILGLLPVYEYRIFDPHSDVTPALMAFHKNVKVITNYNFIQDVLVKITNIYGEDRRFCDYMEFINNNLIIVSPDAGAYKKIGKLMHALGLKNELETAIKYRDTTNGNITSQIHREDFQKKNILIIDDICVGGRTFIELAEKLIQRNAGDLYLAVSHGIFSNRFGDLHKYFRGIFTTESWQSNDAIQQWVRWSAPEGMVNNPNPKFFVETFQIS